MGFFDRDDKEDKEWARKYILDPLTAPEPNEETGPGTSHYNHLRHRASLPAHDQPTTRTRKPSDVIGARSNTKASHHHHRRHQSTGDVKSPAAPTQPAPSRSSLHPSNPFSRGPSTAPSASPASYPPSSRRYPPVARSSSARVPPPPRTRPGPHHGRSFSADNVNLARQNSLVKQRFPGDMSHRPLDIIKKEARAADRAPHLRRRNMPATDTIDALDTIGGAYHHGGPYDATLASRNTNTLYPPLAAVHDSNLEAIRATPRENIQDSLQRHMPLQGTAAIPSGSPDMSGTVLSYEEGADLMREPDAAGGAYKRWEGIQYHPEDLKGKGEPSYTYERDLKERRKTAPSEYEMQPRSVARESKHRPSTHHRSVSHEGEASSSAYDDHVHRSNTTGKRLSDGFKRRFGSIRRKIASDEAY